MSAAWSSLRAAGHLPGGSGGGDAFAGVLRDHVVLELQHGGEDAR
jgi:hypothetical protein